MIVACAQGHELSQLTAAALRAECFDARYLTGGVQAWQGQGAPMLRQRLDLGVPGDVLMQLAQIVRGADTARPDLAPQAAGLLAISLGYSVLLEDDQIWLAKGIELYDALWVWISRAQGEVHTWQPEQAA